MTKAENTSQRIRNYIIGKFPLAKKKTVSNQDHLLESGILDSMGILEVVEFIEGEFHVTVSDDDLLPENFQSIERIAQFVERGLNPR
jgi:acyl carrier protein